MDHRREVGRRVPVSPPSITCLLSVVNVFGYDSLHHLLNGLSMRIANSNHLSSWLGIELAVSDSCANSRFSLPVPGDVGVSLFDELPVTNEKRRSLVETVRPNVKDRLAAIRRVTPSLVSDKGQRCTLVEQPQLAVRLVRIFAVGWIIKNTGLTEEFTYEDFLNNYNENVVLLFWLNENNKLGIATVENDFKPEAGYKIIALVKGT